MAGVSAAGQGLTGRAPERSGSSSGRAVAPVVRRSTAAEPADEHAPFAVEVGALPRRRGSLVIHGTGDVNLDPTYVGGFDAEGYEHAWTGLDGLFQRDDLTVVNLECPVSELGEPYRWKEYSFRGDPAALPAMRASGVEVANLGNNHARDLGPDALLDTIENLSANGIAPVGAGRDAAAAARPALFEVDGWTVAVLGFGGVLPSWDWLAGPGSPGMASGDDVDAMVRAVRRADRVADLVVVSIHWGVELDLEPRPEDVGRAHAMIDAGADVIFGHHAHRLQPLGWYRGRPIFWGLGNFVWPSHGPGPDTTGVAEVRIDPSGRISATLLPATIESDGHPVLDR